MKDAKIRYRPAELQVVIDHGLRAFCLTNANLRGIEMAQRLLRDVRSRYAGAYLMPSFGRFEVVAEVLDALH